MIRRRDRLTGTIIFWIVAFVAVILPTILMIMDDASKWIK